MISGVLASASPQTFSSSSSSLLSKPKANCNCYATSSVSVHTLCSSDLKLKGIGLYGTKGSRRNRVHCNSSTGPGGPGSGDGDSRSVLDAFFLGKALAEALNERIESSVGEFLSTIGRLQAEQQKQVEEFQEDVLQRAKRAKEKAAREAMEAQGLISKSTKKNTTPVTNGVAPVTSTTTNTVTPVSKPSLSEPALSTTKDEQDPTNQDTVLGVPNDD